MKHELMFPRKGIKNVSSLINDRNKCPAENMAACDALQASPTSPGTANKEHWKETSGNVLYKFEEGQVLQDANWN